MDILFDALNPTNFPNMFTLIWVGAIVICIGASIVYWIAQRRYRRYPAHLAMHEWVYWTILVPWIMVPLLAVIHVSLFIVLAIVIPGMAAAAFGAFIRYPPRVAAANNELRRHRYVPPPRRDTRVRAKPTPAGGRKTHKR
ncbi:MAG TPA: hypothetical protein VGO32_04380 [Candidatus Limnocylindria bacterium]|jgi:purine-cytosine permease-like protein|nr:hypothetical protein [Candidatus Limnocylindria bacterium]